jgi:hypothetical protein
MPQEKSKKWYEFLTSLMAILGGTLELRASLNMKP